MPEIRKLAPEVELPRPRSSGVAVVAVAALAMFTAVGASAFIVRVRMGAPCAHRVERLQARLGPRVDLVGAFVAAVADRDDRAALELYSRIPDEADPTGRLLRLREGVLQRQMAVIQDELARGDCDELRRHVAWLRQAAREDLSVHVGECKDARPRYITVELTQ